MSVRHARVVLGVLLAVGCGGEPTATVDGPPAAGTCDPGEADAVAAVVDGQPVTTADLDASLRLALHDLDLARHALRTAELERRARARPGTRLEVRLEPPIPPLVDFQSPDCRRMQPVLDRVRAEYGERVRLVARAFPQPEHRDARRAAEAAACAARQGAYWPFHDALLRGGTDLSPGALAYEASRLDLDGALFDDCLDGGDAAAAVAADVAEARRLGVPGVPALFVNGRYLRGPAPYEAVVRLVDAELARAGVAPPAERAPVTAEGARRTRLPLVLVGTVVHEDGAQSTAMLRIRDGAPVILGPGDEPLHGVTIEAIEGERIVLRTADGMLEYLPLAAAKP